jgi:hypothetical protein
VDDLSGIAGSVFGGSGMGSGATSPVPDFAAAGSDSQAAPPALPVTDPADVIELPGHAYPTRFDAYRRAQWGALWQSPDADGEGWTST